MNDKRLKQTMLREIAEENMQKDHNPWQAMQARIKDETVKNAPAGSVVKTTEKRVFRPAMVTLSVLIVAFGVFLLASPQGHALAQGILRFFTPQSPSEETVQVAATALPMIDVASFAQTSNPAQKNPSLVKAQEQVGYPLVQLANLSQGYHLETVQVEGERVTLNYKNDGVGIALWFEQSPLHGAAAEPINVGKNALVTSTQIGSDYAEYVQGSYTGDEGEWDSASGASFLRWQHEDQLYTLSAVTSTNNDESASAISLVALQSMANDLTADLSVQESTDPSHLSSVSEAEKLAGVKLLVPSVLPAGYQFAFAGVEENGGFMCLNYAYNGAAYPSLFIRQAAAQPLSTLSADKNNALEVAPVKIAGGENDAQYVIGFTAPGGACGPANNVFRAGQALLWNAGGMSLEIYAEFPNPESGAGLTKEQMIALAESVSGTPNGSQVLADTNVYNDPAEAQGKIGHELQLPSRLPLGSVLNSIHLLGDSTMTLFTNAEFGAPNLRLYQCPFNQSESDSPCQNLTENIPEEFKTILSPEAIHAIYAKGDLGTDAGEQTASWHEEDPAHTQRLFWQTSDWAFLLVSTGEGVNSQSLIEIAESIH